VHEILSEFRSTVADDQLFISLIAGLNSCDFYNYFSGISPKIIRAMPNLACQIGFGITIICPCGHRLTERHLDIIHTMFSKTGLLLFEENEILLDRYTALSASTPAFYALFADAIADGAVLMGVPRSRALQIAIQSLLGTAHLLKNEIEKNCTGSEAADLIHSVCTPAGCTIQGIFNLQKNAVPGHIMEALQLSCNTFKK
jgi:pyrroline-5-carboxylate reductase